MADNKARIIWIAIAIVLCGCAGPTSDSQHASDNEEPASRIAQKTSDTLKSVASALQPNSGWSLESRDSAVTGRQYIAKIREEIPGHDGFSKQVEINCSEETHELSTLLTINSERGDSEPEFIVDHQFSGMKFENGSLPVEGARRVTGVDHAMSSSGAWLYSFKNQARLMSKLGVYPEADGDPAKRFASYLPMALNLESNLGTIEFAIPKTDDILNVVKKCEIPSVVPTPTTVPTLGSVEPVPDSVSSATTVISVDLGTDVGADNKVTEYSNTFASNDTIHASVSTDGAGGKLNAKWAYQDGQTVYSQEKEAGSGLQVTDFSIGNPDGWPIGKYRLDVSLNGRVAQSRDFEVK